MVVGAIHEIGADSQEEKTKQRVLNNMKKWDVGAVPRPWKLHLIENNCSRITSDNLQ